jgi:hypothetical protein
VDFDLSSEQENLLDAIRPLLEEYNRLPNPGPPEYCIYGDKLDRALDDSGYYGDADGLSIDRADAALLVEQISKSPYPVPAMASLIVAPWVCKVLPPRPIALVGTRGSAPVRFLQHARTALIDAGDEVLMLDLTGVKVESVPTIFAYPYARLASVDRSRATVLAGVSCADFRNAWRLGLTYEMLGAMRSAVSLTVDYVKQRQQFKRPIGSFQAVQHRLSEDAVQIEAIHVLAARAAWSGDAGDIAIAAAQAQKATAQLIYDCHQFHGAMGLTLEYVLHHWTYRLKVLAGELGGASAQARAAAQALWGTAA